MDLGDFVREVAATYNAAEGVGTPTQQFLRDASTHLSEHASLDIRIVGSGGKGVATFTPWVGFFDTKGTSSPQDGIYVVYLFSKDLRLVNLSLNQGMERRRQRYRDEVTRGLLIAEAARARALLGTRALHGLKDEIDLRSDGVRQRAYKAGNIAAVVYETRSLPPEATLRTDLARFLDLYRLTIEALRGSRALISDEGTVASPDPDAGGRLVDFRPKNAGDYRAHLNGRILTKSRTHEQLVRDFGERMRELGFKPSTPHPRDLTLQKDGIEWLVEAKVVYDGNATEAVRAAVGQLLSYRHFFYQTEPDPMLLALFSESVEEAYCEFLESLAIGVVWRTDNGWQVSRSLEMTRFAEL